MHRRECEPLLTPSHLLHSAQVRRILKDKLKVAVDNCKGCGLDAVEGGSSGDGEGRGGGGGGFGDDEFLNNMGKDAKKAKIEEEEGGEEGWGGGRKEVKEMMSPVMSIPTMGDGDESEEEEEEVVEVRKKIEFVRDNIVEKTPEKVNEVRKEKEERKEKENDSESEASYGEESFNSDDLEASYLP